MNRVKKHSKRILIDGLGYACLIIAPLIAWLPGPGGIPLILAGLSLLSINNHWAKRLLEHSKNHTENLSKIAFPDNKNAQLGWDLVNIAALIGGTISLLSSESLFKKLFSYMLLSGSIIIFSLNRNRFQRLKARLIKH